MKETLKFSICFFLINYIVLHFDDICDKVAKSQK